METMYVPTLEGLNVQSALLLAGTSTEQPMKLPELFSVKSVPSL